MDKNDCLDDRHCARRQTRPLLGLTVLVVEDSRLPARRCACSCLRSGARIRRADCLASARRHLQVYRPSVVIVDLGLPDGSGAELLAELSGRLPRVAVLLGTSGDTLGRGGGAGRRGGRVPRQAGHIRGRLPGRDPWQPAAGPAAARPADGVGRAGAARHARLSRRHGACRRHAGRPCRTARMLDYVAQFLTGVGTQRRRHRAGRSVRGAGRGAGRRKAHAVADRPRRGAGAGPAGGPDRDLDAPPGQSRRPGSPPRSRSGKIASSTRRASTPKRPRIIQPRCARRSRVGMRSRRW